MLNRVRCQMGWARQDRPQQILHCQYWSCLAHWDLIWYRTLFKIDTARTYRSHMHCWLASASRQCSSLNWVGTKLLPPPLLLLVINHFLPLFNNGGGKWLVCCASAHPRHLSCSAEIKADSEPTENLLLIGSRWSSTSMCIDLDTSIITTNRNWSNYISHIAILSQLGVRVDTKSWF